MRPITREQIIESMCFTFRHDYGLRRDPKDPNPFGSGMTIEEQRALYDSMAQIFDNDIAPHMEFKHTHVCVFQKIDPYISSFMGKRFVMDERCPECGKTKAAREARDGESIPGSSERRFS